MTIRCSFVMVGLIVEIVFILRDNFFSDKKLCDVLKMSEYEVHWLTDFSLINSLACIKKKL